MEKNKNNKVIKITIVIILILIMIIGLIVGLCIIPKNNKDVIKSEEDIFMEDIQINNELKNIDGKYTNIIINDFETAQKSIEEIKDKIGIVSVGEELKKESFNDGSEYINTYQFRQLYKGIEVYTGTIIIYTDKQGNAKGIINKYNEIPSDFNINPINTSKDLEDIALKAVNDQNIEILESKLIIYCLENQKYTLAYEYILKTTEGQTSVIINDLDKKLIDKSINISTINSLELKKEELNKLMIDENTYKFIDNERQLKVQYFVNDKINPEDYVWNKENIKVNENLVQISKDELDLKLGFDTLKTVQKAYDYYHQKFKVNSIKGTEKCWLNIITGASVIKGSNYSNNAFWDTNNMIVYGSDNLYNNDIEVATHEYLHGIMNYKLGVKTETDYYRSILEEAYGDIFGMCAECYYNNSSRIDGKIATIRNIKESNLLYDNLPKTYKDFKKGKKNGKDEHYYSVIISKVAYLMNEKLTLNELENLWFNSLELLADRRATINDCYYAVVRTSQIMGFSEEKQKFIKECFENMGFGKIEINNDDIKTNQDNQDSDKEENKIVENTELKKDESNKPNEKNNNSQTNSYEYVEEKNEISKITLNKLSKEKALTIIENNFENWKDLKLSFKYDCTVKDQSGNQYYAINAFSPENFMYHGGEWLEEVENGTFYAGTYYVALEYSNNLVKVGKNQRDWKKYHDGEIVTYFTTTYNLEIKN